MANYSLALSELKDKFTLDNTTAPKELFWEDETVYGTSGQAGKPPISNRYRVIRLTVNGVVTYDTNFRTSPDHNNWVGAQSDLSASDTTTSINLPLNTDGSVVEGIYKIEINTLYKDDDSINDNYSLLQGQISFQVSYKTPKPSLAGSVDLGLTPEIKWVDQTPYVVNGITPSRTGDLEYFDPFGNSVTSPTPALQLISNIVYTGTSSATINRTLVWDYTNEVFTSATNTYGQGNWTLLVKDSVSTRKELLVGGDANLCTVYCCVKTLRDDYKNLLSKGNYSQADKVFIRLNKATMLMSYAQLAVRCGKTSELNSLILEVKDLANCGNDCCDDDNPQLIPDLSGTSNTNKVIVFNTGTGATRVFAGAGMFRRNVNNTSELTHPDLTGKTFTSSRRDFDIFSDGVLISNGTFTPNSGLFTFPNQVSTEVEIQIRFY